MCSSDLETNFFHMCSAQPEVLFENSSSGIQVRCDGHEHAVNVIHPAPTPAGFDKLYNFATSVEKRGKQVKMEKPAELPK